MFLCLFDIDGTLLRTGGAGMAALERAFEELFGETAQFPRELEISGRTDRSIVVELFERFDIETSEANWQRFTAAYIQHLPLQMAELSGQVLPGVVSLLELLRQRDDVTLGLLTGNLQRGAELKLQHYSLDGFFPFGGYGDAHVHRDDIAREAYRKAAEHMTTPPLPERTLVIGDTPSDITCAKAIGAVSIAVATGRHPKDALAPSNPDLLLDNLSDPQPFMSHLV